jgi:hypothetical protein
LPLHQCPFITLTSPPALPGLHWLPCWASNTQAWSCLMAFAVLFCFLKCALSSHLQTSPPPSSLLSNVTSSMGHGSHPYLGMQYTPPGSLFPALVFLHSVYPVYFTYCCCLLCISSARFFFSFHFIAVFPGPEQ